MEFAAYPHAVTHEAGSVTDVSRWVCDRYGTSPFDVLIGHSMGGIIALELAADMGFECGTVILIESNLRPAGAFYRNLMTPAHMQAYGDRVMGMLKGEAPFYSAELKKTLQEDFDYTDYVKRYDGRLYGIYGDRGVRDYPDRIADLHLSVEVAARIRFSFVHDACHLPMLENPAELVALLGAILGSGA